MIKNREVPTELKGFNSVFNSLVYRHDVSQVYRDFLGIVISCLGHGTREKEYFEIIKRYDKKELQLFSNLFGELMKYYDRNISDSSWCDPLGTYYEILAGNYKKASFGQFFTPPAICEIIARFSLEEKTFGKTINEPACGSGRMVLAANTVAKGNKYICQDLDNICCQMAAINLAFHKIDGIVYCMDTLANSKPTHTYITNLEYWKNKTISILQP